MRDIIRKATNITKKVWKFIWEDDSIWSWLANVVVAFLLIRFIVYPLLGIILGTGYPIVAVVSESMEHGISPICIESASGRCIRYSKTEFKLCDQQFTQFYESYDNYWNVCGDWYEKNDITKEQFKTFRFRDGFRKGDVMFLWRANVGNLKVGDVLVYEGGKPQPIIHRIVKMWEEDGEHYYQTKGDHNSRSISKVLQETKISEERIYGKAIVKIPYLGWLKILFVDAVKPLGINIER